MKGFSLVCLLTGMLLVSACQDSSTVGVDLVGEQGEPTTEVLPLAELASVPFTDITGGTPRLLSGDVDDPALGRITATSYADFSGSFGSPDDSTVSAVSLQLRPDYAYGDTTASLTLGLFEVLEAWDDDGRTADTTLSIAETPLTETTFVATDTLVTLPLPDTWIADNQGLFTSGAFEDALQGFALRMTSPGAVVGFSASDTQLRVVTPTDTIAYQTTKTLSSLARVGEPTLPANLTLLQDGIGPTVRFDVDLSAFTGTPVNGTVVRFFSNGDALGTPPANFVRPPLERVQLFLIDEENGEEIELQLATDAVGEDGTLRFTSTALRELFQRTLFGEDLYEALELRVDPVANTINPLLLYTSEAPERAPEVLLTLSPADQ